MYLDKIRNKMKNNLPNWIYSAYKKVTYVDKTTEQDRQLNRLNLIYDNANKELPVHIDLTKICSDAIAANEIFINNSKRVLIYFNDLYDCETTIKSPTEKRQLSVNILIQYLNQIFEQNKFNILYSDGSSSISTKQSFVQRDIEEKKIKESLYDLLYSIQLQEIVKNKKSNKRTKLNDNFFLKKKKETLQLLVANEILNKNNEFNTNSIFFKPRKQAILLVKLGDLKIINVNNQSNATKYFNEFFKTKIFDSNVCEISNDLMKKQLNRNDKNTLEELAFLDELSK